MAKTMRLENEKFGDLNHTGVRIPTELKAKIKSAAKENKQSMNAEIVRRLERTFHQDENAKRKSGKTLEELLGIDDSGMRVITPDSKSPEKNNSEMLPLQEQIDYLDSRIDELSEQIRALQSYH